MVEVHDHEQYMKVVDCRNVQHGCSSDLHERLDEISAKTNQLITDTAVAAERSKRSVEDLAVIKKHLGINGQYTVISNPPMPPRRAGDPQGVNHAPERVEGEVIVATRGDRMPMVSFPAPPRWMVVLFVLVFLLAGAGMILMLQSKSELETAIETIQQLRENKGVFPE